jgi:DNA excision repair protein ERCC-4
MSSHDDVIDMIQSDDNDDNNEDNQSEVRQLPRSETLQHDVDEKDNDEDDENGDSMIPDGIIPLYLQDAFTDLFNEDGLLCIGKGLQYLILLAIFCKYYTLQYKDNRSTVSSTTTTTTTTTTCNQSSNSDNTIDRSNEKRNGTDTSQIYDTNDRPTSTVQQKRLLSNQKRPLIFILGMKDEKEYQTLIQILISWGTITNDQLPIMITNEAGQAKDRELLYQRGGIIVITSRILIVDLLSGIVVSSNIYGLLIVHAHTVTDQSTESFIIRIYKSYHFQNQQQQQDETHSNQSSINYRNNNSNQNDKSGFIKAITDNADALMTGFAQVDKILKALHVRKLYLYPRFHSTIRDELESSHNIEVIEYHQELSIRQKEIQSSIAVLVMQCLRQLKQQTDHLVQWSNHNHNNSNGDEDSTNGMLSVENCITQQFDIAISRQLEPYWHKLSHGTKQLVQDLRTLKTLLIALIQYDCVTFYKLLSSIRTMSAASRYPSMWLLEPATDILFRKAKERVYTIVHPEQSSKTSPDRPVSHLITTLEENPKWKLLKTVLHEIQQDHITKRELKQLDTCHDDTVTNVLVMVKDDKVLETIKAYLTDENMNAPTQQSKKGSKKSLSQPIVNTPRILHTRWLRYLEHMNDRSRNITDTRGSTDTLSEESRLLLEEEGHIRRILYGNSEENKKGKGNRNTIREKHQVEQQQVPNQKKRPAPKTKYQESQRQSSSSPKVLNQVPSYVRQRRRIAVEKGRGQAVSTTDDIHRRAVLEEAIEITEHDMDHTSRFTDTNTTVDIDNNIDDHRQIPGNQNVDGVDNEDGDDDDIMFRVSYPENELRAVVHCYSLVEGDQSHLLLQDIRPKYIVFYDTDVAFIRAVEIYAALSSNNQENGMVSNIDPIRVYFLMFEASAEEKTYKKTLEREQNSFERLINHKKTMTVPILQSMETQEMQEALQNSPAGVAGTYMDGKYALSMDTRRGKGKVNTSKERRDIAVDVREFRSALPNILHQGGMRLAPVTLTVGDYVLSNVHCVERKSISDLFGSFAGGRLYSQAEAMSKYYTCPCLLIEFDPNKSFCLQNSNELGIDVRIDSVCSKMVLLATHFPKLRILWSRGPQNTLKLFRDLKVNHDEVDVERAIEIGRNESEEYLLQPDNRDGEEDEINEAARDMLLRLPGVNVRSARRIMQECDSLAELSQLSRDELRRIAGPATGQKLFTFFRQNIGAM